MKITRIVVILLLGILLLSGFACVGGPAVPTPYVAEEFAICTNPAEQDSPAISGDIVVWMDSRNGNLDIYGYNLSTGEEFAICTDPGPQLMPAISGDIVVWADKRKGNYDIYAAILSFEE